MKKVEENVTDATQVITNEELKNLQSLVGKYNENQMLLGKIEIDKASILTVVFKTKAELEKLQLELKEKYGDIVVNLDNGEFKEATNESNT